MCKLCNKRFKSKWHVKTHSVIHKGNHVFFSLKKEAFILLIRFRMLTLLLMQVLNDVHICINVRYYPLVYKGASHCTLI
jgi:hypothetical protein